MEKIRFDNFLKLNRGFDLPDSQIEEGSYPVVASTSIKAYHNEYKVDGPMVTTGRSGSLGKVVYVDGKCWPLNTTLYVKDFKGNVPRYVYYYLQMMHLEQFNAGAGVPTLNQNHLHSLKIIIHSKDEQQKIASILSTYDNLIENNTKRIRLLEQMAEGLYKEWFVRFRFPGHENVEMENGLPKGWKIEKVANWCRVFTGKKDVNQTNENGQYLFFSCSPNAYHSDEYIYDGKAILVAGNGSYTGRTRYYEGKFDLYQRTYAIVSNKEEDDFLFYLYNRFKFDFEPLHSGGTRGAAIPYIVMKDITRYTFLYNKAIVSLYIKYIKPMFKEIENLHHQNQLLTRQRDLLLPRLMSGKLEVKA